MVRQNDNQTIKVEDRFDCNSARKNHKNIPKSSKKRGNIGDVTNGVGENEKEN